MGARTLRGNAAEGLALVLSVQERDGHRPEHIVPAKAGTQVCSLTAARKRSH